MKFNVIIIIYPSIMSNELFALSVSNTSVLKRLMLKSSPRTKDNVTKPIAFLPTVFQFISLNLYCCDVHVLFCPRNVFFLNKVMYCNCHVQYNNSVLLLSKDPLPKQYN